MTPTITPEALNLLPCPFCGNEAEFVPYKQDGLTLRCKSLGCVRRDQRTLHQSIDWLRQVMVADWNKRAALHEPQAAPAAAGVPDGLIPASPDIEYLRSVSHGPALPALLRGNIMSALRWIDTLQTRLANPQPAQPMEDWINQWPRMPGDQLIKMRAAWGAGYHYGSSAIPARQPVGEPVAVVTRKGNLPGSIAWTNAGLRADIPDGAALYTAPPAPAAAVAAVPQGVDLLTPRPMETAPRDGTMLRLLVQFEEHATEDTDGPAWTIGANSFDETGEDLWQFAGWCWTHDHFTEGKGTPVGWLPLIDSKAVRNG